MTRRTPTVENARRKPVTVKMMREALLMQAYETDRPIICPLCLSPILPGGPTILEHLDALGLGGLDTPENRRLAHKHCAYKKTYGTKATTAGSDIHLIAKGKRLRGETGLNCHKRPMPGSRGGKWKKRVDGTVVLR